MTDHPTPPPAQSESDVPEQMRVRREKMDRLARARDRSVSGRLPRTATIAELRAEYPDLAPDAQTGQRVGIAGRVMLSRTGGKLCFATLRDGDRESR